MQEDDRSSDTHWMERALELARQGEGQASPNPMVGAVLVKEGRAVGEGFHTYTGLRHAEIVALDAAGHAARGAKLYVNLEPCCHTGRTGPCTDAILAAGVRQVVVADHVFSYAADLVRATRPREPNAPKFIPELLAWGAGPRASSPAGSSSRSRSDSRRSPLSASRAASSGFVARPAAHSAAKLSS